MEEKNSRCFKDQFEDNFIFLEESLRDEKRKERQKRSRRDLKLEGWNE